MIRMSTTSGATRPRCLTRSRLPGSGGLGMVIGKRPTDRHIDAAKPLLIPTVTGQTCVFGESAQKAVATWAAMATMTAEYLMHEKSLIAVAEADREWLWQNGSPPPDWRIWIGRYQRHRLAEQWT